MRIGVDRQMTDAWVDIPCSAGSMNTFVTFAEHDEPQPLILLLMDAGGMREELCDMARRLAAAGYYVMVPNLYYRLSRDFSHTSRSREDMFAYMDSLSNSLVCTDIAALIHHAEQVPHAATSKIGCVGYCMGGPFAFAAAAAFPDRVAAAASFHGVRLFHAGPDSPHLAADRISAELYIGCAQSDEWAPTSLMQSLDDYLSTTSLSYRLEWYPDTQHGFVFAERDGIYHAQAAERHWQVLLDLYARKLPRVGLGAS